MIKVIDNFLPQDILHPLENMIWNTKYSFGWKSNSKLGDYSHWNHDFMQEQVHGRMSRAGQETVLNHETIGPFFLFLEKVLGKFDVSRCYTNAYTHGTDGLPHTDELGHKGGHLTAMLYMVDRWKPEWAGATAIWNEDASDIEVCVLPRRNRLILFPSHRLHVGWGVSRACPMLRQVFVTKVRPNA